MVFLIALALVLCALIAWYGAREDGQIVVSRGVTLFLMLFSLLGWSLYTHEAWSRDRRLDTALAIARDLAAVAQRAGAEVDTARAAMDELLGKVGR